MIRLFEVEGKVVKPSEHCYMIPFLKVIMDKYPDDYIQVYGYLFYMTCVGSENPFRNLPEHSKERIILNKLQGNFNPEDPVIREALRSCELLYETASSRAYKGIKVMMDKLSEFFENEPITAGGREGNLSAMVNSAKQFDQLRKSFKGITDDVDEEQKSIGKGRGGAALAYDLEDDDEDDD